MSENMSAEGMTKDLEALAEVGVGGVLIFNVTQGIPVGKVKFNSDEHTAIMAHAAAECQRLGLTFGMHNCDGWSSSGGPWNTPENSMKQVVWARSQVQGGRVEAMLNHPQVTAGFYEDIATLAWPASEAELADAAARFTVSATVNLMRAWKPQAMAKTGPKPPGYRSAPPAKTNTPSASPTRD